MFTPPMLGTMKVQLAQPRMERVLQLNADPRRRTAAARIVRHEAANLIRFAEDIARDEFRQDRSGSRRPPESRGKPHYVDSFFVDHQTKESINQTRVAFGNRHPSARRIEHGTDPHIIEARGVSSGTGPVYGQGHLSFPVERGQDESFRVRTPGGPPGRWAVNTGITITPVVVNHPGMPAFHVFRRARQRYHDHNRTRPSRR